MQLLDALDRYYAHASASDPTGSAAFDEIERWFHERSGDDPRSFERLCREIGLDARRVRDALVRRRAAVRDEH